MSEPIKIVVILDDTAEVRVCTFGVPVEALIIDYTRPDTIPSGWVRRELPGSEAPFCERDPSPANLTYWRAETLQLEELALLAPLLEEMRDLRA